VKVTAHRYSDSLSCFFPLSLYLSRESDKVTRSQKEKELAFSPAYSLSSFLSLFKEKKSDDTPSVLLLPSRDSDNGTWISAS
jgi:hypothetical protein